MQNFYHETNCLRKVNKMAIEYASWLGTWEFDFEASKNVVQFYEFWGIENAREIAQSSKSFTHLEMTNDMLKVRQCIYNKKRVSAPAALRVSDEKFVRCNIRVILFVAVAQDLE